jgi:hypothetical protein
MGGWTDPLLTQGSLPTVCVEESSKNVFISNYYVQKDRYMANQILQKYYNQSFIKNVNG